MLTRKTALLTEINALNEQEAAIKAQTTIQLTAFIDELPIHIGKLTGQTHTISEIADMLNRRAKGTFGKVSVSADRTKRLSVNDQKKAVEMLAARDAQKAANLPHMTIRAIAEVLDTSAQTINAYEKKRLAALKAEASRIPSQTPDPMMDAIKPEVAATA